MIFAVSAASPSLAAVDAEASSKDPVVIDVNLPSKLVHDVKVVSLLPRGLIYEDDSLSISGAASSATQTIEGPNDGTDDAAVAWSFGDVDNCGGQDIEISFRAVMADVASNQGDEVLPPIRASVSWKDVGGAIYSSSDESGQFRIVEPDLIIEREANTALVEAEDSVTFTILLQHSLQSESDAFDVDVEEALPEGMDYIPGSMEIPFGPAGMMDDSDPSRLRWHFDAVDASWSDAKSVVLRYGAVVQNVQEGQEGDGSDPFLGNAILTWSSTPGDNPDEREYFASSKNSLDLQPKQGLIISQEDMPDPVSPGGVLNYTISFESLSQDAHGVVVTETYDDGVVYLFSSPQPDEGTDNRWTIGDLLQGETGSVSLAVRVKPSINPETNSSINSGTTLKSTVEIHSADGLNASKTSITAVKGRASLSIENNASSALLSPGQSLNYTLTFKNKGDAEASNVTVSDVIDGNLEFQAYGNATPQPDRIWTDHEGTHLWWSAEALGSESLKPGESGRVEIRARLPSKPEHPSIDRVFNLYKVDSDQSTGSFRSLETFVVQSLFVRKKAEKDACHGGDILNYTILYGNKLDVPARDAVVTDVLPDVEFVAASPEPSYIKDNLLAWGVGTISPLSSGSISLSVRVKEIPKIGFWDSQSVFGSGRVYARQRLSTDARPSSLINYVNITASYPAGEAHDSSYSSIKLSDSLGVDLDVMRHGSGCYNEVQLINYSERSISFERRLAALASPGLNLTHLTHSIQSTKWAERTSVRNNFRNESLSESHLYTDAVEKEDFVLLDQNQTVYSSRGQYSAGVSRLRYAKRPSGRGDSSMDVSEDRHGSFKSEVHLDSYGRGATYARQSSGSGFVSADMRQSSSSAEQRSYEHGSGSYGLYEILTPGPTVYKDVKMNYTASRQTAGSLNVSYASKWSEGLSSSDGEFGSRISSGVLQGDYILKEALMDSSSLAMTSEFSGTGSLKASAGNEKAESKQVDETFMGSFSLDVSLGISRMPEYLCPHLNVTKRVAGLEGDRVLFRINITNDGNKTLAPLEIRDRLPDGLTFINSSLRPEVDGQNVLWRLLSLPIGGTRTIDLHARWNDSYPAVLNEVDAAGYYGNRSVTSKASCTFPGWHECPQDMRKAEGLKAKGSKNAAVFPGDPWKPSPCMDVEANLSCCLPEDFCGNWEGSPFGCSCSS
jgi:uncharacterized repeat protein (TIGR01451 family)